MSVEICMEFWVGEVTIRFSKLMVALGTPEYETPRLDSKAGTVRIENAYNSNRTESNGVVTISLKCLNFFRLS